MKKSNVFLQRTLFTEDTRAIGAFEYDVIIEPCFVMRFLVHMETSTSRKISPAQCAQLHDIFIPVIKVRIVYKKWYFVTKIVLTNCEKKLFYDREKLLKFKAKGREFTKILRSPEQFIQTVKGQNNFW